MKPVEALARIRFNPGNLERWLAAACSLADVSLDAPQRDKVLAAAREARALGLLIDHLRCLFTHQWGVEEEAAAVQFIHQQANHSPAATTLDGSFLMTNTIHQLQDMEDQKALIFSHSNQQTLFRAARNLTSLVARILFLTDGSFEEQQDDNAMPTTQETNNKKPVSWIELLLFIISLVCLFLSERALVCNWRGVLVPDRRMESKNGFSWFALREKRDSQHREPSRHWEAIIEIDWISTKAAHPNSRPLEFV